MAAGGGSGDTVLRAGTFRTVPEVAADKAGSVEPRARRMVRRRCVAVAARIAGLARNAILSKVLAATVSRDFVETPANRAALHPCWAAAGVISGEMKSSGDQGSLALV